MQTVGAELEAISGEPGTIEETENLIDRSDDWLLEDSGGTATENASVEEDNDI